MALMPATTEVRKRLSKNFWLYEVDCRDGTAVPADKVDALQEFVARNLLQQLER